MTHTSALTGNRFSVSSPPALDEPVPPPAGRGRAPAALPEGPLARRAPAAARPGSDRKALKDWSVAAPGMPPRGGLWQRVSARLHLGGAAKPHPLAYDFRERRAEAAARVLQARTRHDRTLDLSGLALSELPPGLEGLEHLEHLDISNNTGFHKLSETLARCHQLKSITARNSFVTEVPPDLFLLPRLETLDLSGNFGLDRLPGTIGQAQQLRTLRLSHCRFERLPEELAQLSGLEEVDLSNNTHLHELPPGWEAGNERLKLGGTPAAFAAELLRPAAWTAAERQDLDRSLEGIAAPCAPADPHALDAQRWALFERECGDGTVTQASWEAAARAVESWVAQDRPLTPDGLLELGWRVNGSQPHARRLRAHEFQRVPAGTEQVPTPWGERFPTQGSVPHAVLHYTGPEPRVAEYRSYPPVQALPGHLEAVCARLEGQRGTGGTLGALERAALLYQAVASLRPLPSGNAPAALLAMDWALQREGLPPALLPPGENDLCDAVVFAGERSEGASALARQLARSLSAWSRDGAMASAVSGPGG
ncbi:leucine-rich repeat domain-containing protein [Acidovorax sp. GBBC 3334]|uniref:leucine-rich repeat domain-containing protein n=1 Tax=Acidovorax sp. GBBC 3334 TaxID=2940496 RepID=UPI00230218F5|nr:leucine-rich repeat domain-containing protein [Acidovorax sp. GBBC 3334]MDA8455147.1 leucine-rich repeat domain-containing protein [Acidovorax sp. GBBC 3334]